MKLQFSNLQLEKEIQKITKFIKTTFKKQGFKKAVIGVSGGIDSSLCLTLLSQALRPENVICLILPYGKQNPALAKVIIKKAKIPQKNVYEFNIKKAADKIWLTLEEKPSPNLVKTEDKIRFGNLMARIRMILLFDKAKKINALVCGTENKSEHLLGYFTRFGDEASDLEPIRHLFKTQVKQLASYLKIPKKIINQAPSAGLWQGQEDEKELGFSYKEADLILHLALEKKLKAKEIKRITKIPFKTIAKVLKRVKNNSFKQKTPYLLK